MRTGVFSKALPVVAMLLFVGLLAGCGGGGEQSGQGKQGDGGGGQKKAAKGGAGKDAPETKIALGRVVSAKPDKRIVAMRSHMEEQRGERMVFRIKKNAQITLDDEKADVEAIKDDQQIRVEYISKEKLDRALTVNLFAPEEKSDEGGQEGQGGTEGEGGEENQEAEGSN